jgi:hypothetical protein
MPREFFRSLPKTQYDVNKDGVVKIATNILTRIARKSNLALTGGVFYNYPMQDGDTVEIIADKYYGHPKYHWVVMLINNAYHNIYDFPLRTENFARFIDDKYGSYERSVGVTKVISDANTYIVANVYSEIHSVEQTTDNSTLRSGTIPAGNTTTIKLSGSTDPFSTLGVGDVVELFVPSAWHNVSTSDSSKLGYTQPAKILSKSQRSDGAYAISTNMDSTRYPEFTWQVDGSLRTISGTTSAPTTANVTHIWLDTGTTSDAYSTNGFITFTSTPGATDSTKLIGNSFPIESYNASYNVLVLGDSYKLPENFQEGWNYTITYGGYEITTIRPGDTRIEGEDITLRSAIHHFEMDVYSDNGTLLLKDHRITKNEYVDPSIGTASNKRIVNNYDHELYLDSEKRNIILLRRELLEPFIEQFNALLGRNR